MKAARLIRAIIIVSWLCISAWFLRYEAFPDFFTHSARGYDRLFSRGILVKDKWMKIIFDGEPIGYSHTKVDMNEHSFSARYQMMNETLLNLKLMGMHEQLGITTDVDLDGMHHLTAFRFRISSQGSVVRVNGKRRKGTDSFNVTIHTGGSVQRLQVEIPDDTVIYSPSTDLAMARLKPGQSLLLKTLDPMSMSTTEITVTALSNETISFGGSNVLTTVLATDYMGMVTRSWISKDGEILRQETPLGFIAEAAEPREAMNAGFKAAGVADVLTALAVQSSTTIIRPRDCRRLRLRLTGVELDPEDLASNRQVVHSSGEKSIELTVSSSHIGLLAASNATDSADLQKNLAAEPYIQSDHKEIIARAKSLVDGQATSIAAATAIFEWVHKNVAKRPAPGVPSALDVLHTMEGDCNEHTYLFVALARAAGLPAKVKVGITYTRGAFYYHAWPAVHVGQWVEMDPTFGQRAIDATHIALFEGGFAEQLGLVPTLGRLRVEVLSQEH